MKCFHCCFWLGMMVEILKNLQLVVLIWSIFCCGPNLSKKNSRTQHFTSLDVGKSFKKTEKAYHCRFFLNIYCSPHITSTYSKPCANGKGWYLIFGYPFHVPLSRSKSNVKRVSRFPSYCCKSCLFHLVRRQAGVFDAHWRDEFTALTPVFVCCAVICQWEAMGHPDP